MTIHDALKVVADKDSDRATTLNLVGFSMNDSDFGNKLAERESLTPKMEWYAARLVRKYRKQIAKSLGICEGLKGKSAEAKLAEFLTSLVWEHQNDHVDPVTIGTISALVSKDTHNLKAFVIRFPYNQNTLEMVKALPSRRYDASDKKWVVDNPDENDKIAIRKLVNSGFDITDGAKGYI